MKTEQKRQQRLAKKQKGDDVLAAKAVLEQEKLEKEEIDRLKQQQRDRRQKLAYHEKMRQDQIERDMQKKKFEKQERDNPKNI